jgi:CheY-like chemotaxis protein
MVKPCENDLFVFHYCSDYYSNNLNLKFTGKDTEEDTANSIVVSIDIENNKDIKLIIIDRNLGVDNWNRAIRIAGHICTHNFEKCDLDLLPIVLTDWENIELSDLSELPITNFFATEGVYFRNYAQIFRRIKNRSTGDYEFAIEDFLRRKPKPVNWQQFNIPYNFDNRHQISNEWGAVRLALNAGYSQSEIDYNFPPTLYFKYLTKNHQNQGLTNSDREAIVNSFMNKLNGLTIPPEKINFSNLLKNKRLLLIDDNADKGWSKILVKLFSENVRSISYKIGILDKKNNINEELSGYDLIFLDLYMPEYQGSIPNIEIGKKILKKIKADFKQIPVIIFTASNKSWTLHEVLDLGADGMYVKESPEYANDLSFSKGNFTSFTKTVVECLLRYRTLRPYWENIENIINDENFINIGEQTNTKFKERIKERLEMFYGLLKRGFEETSYNQEKFHFSDYELAFMTLWSIMNEISELNYEKTKPNTFVFDKEGNQVFANLDKSVISYLPMHRKWTIKNQPEDVFVEYLYHIKYDKNNMPEMKNKNSFILSFNQVSQFLYDKQNESFKIDSLKNTKTNYETTLYLQIAYLIEKQSHLESNNKSCFQNVLVKLNEIRNHLYLTHGDEIKQGFYSKTEREKRNDKKSSPTHNITPQGDIKDLFELVGFLLTGKEIRIIF